MKTQQSKSLFFFYLLSSVFCITANAQIVYTDVNPDITIVGGGIYNLDLNNDGITDFTFSIDSSTIYCGFLVDSGPLINATIQTANLNSIALSSSGVCENFSTSVTINLALQYSLASQEVPLSSVGECKSMHMGGGYCACHHGEPWSLGLNEYAGIRIQISGLTYYGWVHLNVEHNGGQVTIEDYAYNSIPDQSILAGDTGSIATNIHHIKSFSSLAISPNSFQHLTRISFSLPQPEKITVSIYDVTGRVIKILADEIMSAGTRALTWDARDENGNAVSAGIYFLQLQSPDFSQTEKLIVVQ